MRVPWLLGLLTLTALSGGCDVFELAGRNLAEGPVDRVNQATDRTRNRCLADNAWDEYEKAHPDPEPSGHFAKGFLDGYADYLDFGGNGQPPPVPPWRYQQFKYETPLGLQAVHEWFAGFRAGAAAAMASEQRPNEIVPGSGAAVREVDSRPARVLPYVGGTVHGGGPGEPIPEPLPPPHPSPMPPADPTGGPGTAPPGQH